jgi:hypothetical protein
MQPPTQLTIHPSHQPTNEINHTQEVPDLQITLRSEQLSRPLRQLNAGNVGRLIKVCDVCVCICIMYLTSLT